MKKIDWKKVPLFWWIWGGVILLFAICLTVGLLVLNSYLTSFENSQPIHFAQAVFDQYFQKEDFTAALEKAGYTTGEFETLADASRKLKEMQEGKDLSFYSASAMDGKAQYNVVLTEKGETEETSTDGGKGIASTKIASLYFTRQTEADSWGFAGYDLEKMEMFVPATRTLTVVLPSTSTLKVNGVEVSKDFVTEEEAHAFNEYLPKGVEGITLCTYKIDSLIFDPDLEVIDAQGQAQTLTRDEESGNMTAQLNYNSQAKEKLGQRILSGMKEYAKYIQNDGSIGKVAQYFDTTSMFYRNIALNPGAFVWDHNGFEFKNESVDDFYQFDENTVCCHVSFDQVLKKTGREDYVDVLDMIVFAKRRGNQFYIYDRIVQ